MTGTLAIIRVGSAASGMDLDAFAAACGLHPELVRRFAALGLVEPGTDSSGHLWFHPRDVSRVARIQRLRAGLGLNYAAVGLVLDLLDRLATQGGSGAGGRSWISID
ncbi:MAG TPA: chaperone modulator CbpM [Micromonosporaceae bacterium]|nr:chaperone modulator CbpM [Micromonosporaceae bacterium]